MTAPLWVSAPVNGLLFGLAMALGHRMFGGSSWSSALIGGGLSGLVYGALMAPVLHRQRRRLLAATGELPDAQIPSAARASFRGPVPADPLVRAAAARLSAQQGELLARQRLWGVPFFAVMTAVACWLALTDAPWWWAGVAVFGVLLGFQLVGPRRFRRRAELLKEA
jgi:hypothetical protein